MIITYFRSSSFNCHSLCAMQFFGEYVLGWRGPSGIKADKGTIVHKVLEIAANAKLAHDKKAKSFTDDIAGEVKISKKEVLTTEDIDAILEKVFGWYTSHSTQHNWSEADYKECHKWVWKALEFRGGAFDPRQASIVQAEARFDITIEEPWAFYSYDLGDNKVIEGFLAIKGTIDQIVKVDDTTYEVVDWKTGRRLNWATGEEKTHEKLRDDPQLRMYHYAVHKMYPHLKQVIVTIYYINDGGPFTLCFTDEDLPKTEKMLQEKFEVIKNTQIPRKNVTWKCTKFCNLGKSTFDGTDVEPIIAKKDGHITKKGQIMSKCEQLDYVLSKRPLNAVVKYMSSPDHQIDKYNPPGEVKEEK